MRLRSRTAAAAAKPASKAVHPCVIWIAGDYSIADMASLPWIVPWTRQQQDLDQFPNLRRWFEAMRNRPAVVRTYEKGAALARAGAYGRGQEAVPNRSERGSETWLTRSLIRTMYQFHVSGLTYRISCAQAKSRKRQQPKTETAMSTLIHQSQTPPSLALGYVLGMTMALGAATSFAMARAGALRGLAPEDMILARAAVAGLVMLPFLVRLGLPTLAGIGWRRGLLLLLTGGPLFAFLQTGGYAFAPLAHGAVIAPSTVTILSTLGAVVLLGERLTRWHVAGGMTVIAGVVLVSWHGFTGSAITDTTWIGDLMFVTSSMLWAVFTILMRKWRIDPIRATAVVAVLTALVVVPGYLTYRGVDRLMTLPADALLAQGIAQGLIQGVVTLLAYSKAIAILGVSRAVLFPAIVPAISILIGIPLVGEWPDLVQITGLVLVTMGLLAAVGLIARIAAVLRPAPAVSVPAIA